MGVDCIKVSFFVSGNKNLGDNFYGGPMLLRIQNDLRKWLSKRIRQGANPELDIFENRFARFPIVGAAKIAAQEVLKLEKSEPEVERMITFQLPNDKVADVFESTFCGYVKHVKEELGQEPYSTVDIIIELDKGVVVIERSNPPYGWALPGGFVDPGEGLREAAIREAKEETNLDLADVYKFNVYGNKDRDPRFHTISTVFIGQGIGRAQFGDDAKGLRVIKFSDLRKLSYAFDHKKIIEDYLKQRGERRR